MNEECGLFILCCQIRLDDNCRQLSEREEASVNNHGLSLKNIKENQEIERGEDAVEVSLPKSDLSDHSVGFIEEKHVLVDNRQTGKSLPQGNMLSIYWTSR